MQVDLNCQWKQSLFLVIDLKKLEDKTLESGEGGLELDCYCPKQQDQNRVVVDEGL